jgi:protein TonB
MEPKKNPKYDLHNKRSVIFNFSLALSIFIVICAFKWSVPLSQQYHKPTDLRDDGSSTIDPITYYTDPQEPPKPKQEKKIVVNPTEFVVVNNEREPNVEIELNSPLNPVPPDTRIDVEEIREVISDTTTFIIVEKPAEPLGGYKQFYKLLQENLKYPPRAKRAGVEGKVLVEFVVDKEGNPVNFKVLRGISPDCDKEAMRVLALSKWNPGKQRGNPVRVRMALQIMFALQ